MNRKLRYAGLVAGLAIVAAACARPAHHLAEWRSRHDGGIGSCRVWVAPRRPDWPAS